ncbi:MAG: HmuY family protein [Chitinophagaceae bacterium]|nr:HmuY family protein [Chitinophagaceae bacterium]
MMNSVKLSLLAGVVIFSLAACNKKDSPVTVVPFQKVDSLKVSFSATSPYTFFSFKNDAVVANSDSATTNWDFGLHFTTFIVNSFASGPGNAGAILQTSTYESAGIAPANGYAYDTTSSKKAIKDGSWYNYNPSTHSFSPKAGQVFFFRTADNKYVKFELLAVDYEPFTGYVPVTLIYRFRYTYQPNGSKNF